MDGMEYIRESWLDTLALTDDWMNSSEYREDMAMVKLRYRNEKDQIIDKLWEIVNRTLEIDDAGCDWFTVGHCTYIADMSWCVSDDAEVAKLVSAINCLNGYPELIYASAEDVPPHMRVQSARNSF